MLGYGTAELFGIKNPTPMKGVAKLVLATKSQRDFIILRNPYFLPFPFLPIACILNSK